MKKFLIALLAALLVVGMMTVAFAETDNGPSGEGEEVPTCSKCGAPLVEKYMAGVNHTVPGSMVLVCSKDSTHQEPITLYAVAATAHDADWGKTKVIDGKTYAWCNICKDYVVEITATVKHDCVWDKGTVVVQPTCVSEGLIKYVCLEHGEIKLDTVDMLSSHTFDLKAIDTYVRVRATCTTNGRYEARCTVCGGIYSWDIANDVGYCVTPGKVKDINTQQFTYTDEETGESFTVTATVRADYNNITASKPRGTKVLKIAARGHKWTEGSVTKAPTCLEDGVAQFKCLNIDQTDIYDPCTVKTDTKILDHNDKVYDDRVRMETSKYHNWIEVVEKPIGADGYGIHYYYCKTCGLTSEKELPFTAATIRYNGQYDAKKAGLIPGSATTPSKSSSSGSKSSSSSTNKKGVSIPKTNDTTSNLPYVLIAVAFVGLVALVASKKKVNG